MSLLTHSVAPRFVPTLTEVVDQPPHNGTGQGTTAQSRAPRDGVLAEQSPAPVGVETIEAMEEQIVQRVLARVDAVLAGRLSDAIALVVLEQTRFMLPRLREEIAVSVRNAVSAALTEERGAWQAPSAVHPPRA